MNVNQQQTTRATNPSLEPIYSSDAKNDDEIDLLEIFFILRERWKLLALFTFIGLCVGVFFISWIRAQYASDVLLHIDSKNKGSAVVEMGALFDVESPAETEIRLIKSRKVLASVVLQEHLNLHAIPIGFKNRLLKKEGRMDLTLLNIPEVLRTEEQEPFYARAISSDAYEILYPEGQVFLKGKVGETYRKPLAGDTFAISVSRLIVENEQKFLLVQNSVFQTTKQLKEALNVVEDGKKTNIITMSYEHRYADKAVSVLNTIANTYLRQNIEMRSAEAEKTLAFLEEQMPAVKKKLDSAEQALTVYRYQAGTVDLSAEAKVTLERQVNLKTQLLTLEQQLQENARLYKEDHPTMQAIIQQQERLKQEIKKEESTVKKLPMTQQEVMALQQEVSIQNGLYTSMLNNIQQLRVVRVGELGNVRVVDYAEITPIPVKPKKKIILLGALIGGFLVGCGLIFLKQMLVNRGVSSSSLVERETGAIVYAKVPITEMGKKKQIEHVVLAIADPHDYAVEKIRSLRTALEFSFIDNGGKVLAVTGISSGDGKSFISTNLSVLFKQMNKKVLLIDCDLRKNYKNEKKIKGLSDLLYENATLEEVLKESSFPHCDYVGRGLRTTMPSELLASSKFTNVIASLRDQYDLIVIDTPPLNYFSDAQWVCRRADFALLIMRSGAYSMDQIKENLKLLEVAVEHKAIVINQCKSESFGYAYDVKKYRG
jgi:tyrosine-protein kinase Etk/Wzc